MILVDTSIWIDHLRSGDAQLVTLLQDGKVLGHPWVTGELALGNLALRKEILGLLHNLPQAMVATDAEVLTLIDLHRLCGLGIGYVDAHLLASTKLSVGAKLWTRDTRLHATAVQGVERAVVQYQLHLDSISARRHGGQARGMRYEVWGMI